MKKIILFIFFLIPMIAIAQDELDSLAYSIGVELDKSLNEGNPDYFANLFDEDIFANKFIIKNSSNKDLLEFNDLLKKEVKYALPNQFIKEIENGAYYTFINYYIDVFNNYYLIFRLYSEAGINYHEYHLVFDKNKNPKIGDMYIFMTGELFSETISRAYFPNAQKMIAENELDSETLELVNSYEKLASVARMINKGKTLSAWMVYSTIPQKIRDQKNFLMAELRMVDSDKNEEKYIEILDRFQSLYPNDPSWFLLGMDSYFMKGDFKTSLSMVDSLENLTGDDFLNLHRGNIHFQLEDYKKAQACYSTLANSYPYFEDAITSLLITSVSLQDYDTCIKTLEMYIENLEYTKTDIIQYVESDVDYQGLKNSKEYVDWKNNSE